MMVTDSMTNDVLSHTIDVSHLITDNETSWKVFQLVGISGKDGLAYLVACKENLPEIGICSGSYLLPNSWKLINRFSVPNFVGINADHTHSTFSIDFTKIGIILAGQRLGGNYDVMFIVFDLNSAYWEHRQFSFTIFLKPNCISHTCAGWIIYTHMVWRDPISIFRLTMDLTKNCFDRLCHLPPMQNNDVNTVNTVFVYVSNDRLYCFVKEERFIYICYLSRDGFPCERYEVDSGLLDHVRVQHPHFTNKFINTFPIVRAVICNCSRGRKCSTSYDREYLCLLYSVVVNSVSKSCQFEKIAQFRDRPNMIVDGLENQRDDGLYFRRTNPLRLTSTISGLDGILTKSKRLVLFDGWRVDPKLPKLVLTTEFFKLPTLKELASLVLAKTLCQKTVRFGKVYLDRGFTSTTLSAIILTGGPSEEVKEEVGLNNPILNFGQMKA